MFRKIVFSLVLLGAAAAVVLPAAAVGTEENDTAGAPVVAAQSAILMERNTGEVLFSLHPDQRSLVASTTKIMTGLLIAEHCSPDSTVTVPESCCGVEGSSIYLQPGEKVSVRELLYGLMLESGNDAAEALAVYCAGSCEKFAVLMNRKAVELGLTGTHFINPHGLDADGHYSTARDLAVLMCAAMEQPLFAEISGTKIMHFSTRTFVNHNKLLWNCSGVVAGKTGYTMNAGRILVSCCNREGLELVCVTINDRSDWDDHSALYDWGCREFCSSRPFEHSTLAATLPVISGQTEKIPVLVGTNQPLITHRDAEITWQTYLPPFLYAPVQAGDTVGCIEICAGGQTIQEIPLVAGADSALSQPKNRLFSALQRQWESFMELIIEKLNLA